MTYIACIWFAIGQISAHQGGSRRRIPTLGTKHSQRGNKVFPRWESITSLRIANKQHLSSNKEPLLQNKAPLLPLFMSLVCHQYVVSMSLICRFHVTSMSFLCHFKISQSSDNEPNITTFMSYVISF